VAEVAKITDYAGVGIVYDSVGKDTLSKSLECLWTMGVCVSYGETSGAFENFNLDSLVDNSLFITRPALSKYKANRTELILGSNEVFAALNKGIIRPKINNYKFKDVVKAHRDIESKKTMGSLILTF
jgi:NADPH2:quinone reductase